MREFLFGDDGRSYRALPAYGSQRDGQLRHAYLMQFGLPARARIWLHSWRVYRVMDIHWFTEWLRWQVLIFVEQHYQRAKDDVEFLTRILYVFSSAYANMTPLQRSEKRRRLVRAQRRLDWFWTPLARKLDVVPGLGRYEGNGSQIKTAWLDENIGECSYWDDGDTETIGHYALFSRVPWSNKRESWAISCTSSGFRSAWRVSKQEAADLQSSVERDMSTMYEEEEVES
jgi:hypothetical protein